MQTVLGVILMRQRESKLTVEKSENPRLRLEALSDFRFQLSSFMRFSEDAARAEGVTALQHLLMLHTQAFSGRPWATVGELAERLQAAPHGVVALVSRCEEAGLVRRKTSLTDRRQVEVHLMPKGRKKLDRLANLHLNQLHLLAEAVRIANMIEPVGFEAHSKESA